jgi:hypothetical protein
MIAPAQGIASRAVENLGPPIAYTVLEDGTPVYDRNGEQIGVVEHVLADMQLDIFEGVIVHTLPLPGRHLFADVEQIAELHERGVLLSVGRDQLQAPPDDSAQGKRDEEERVESPLERRLRRAWDWLSGRR